MKISKTQIIQNYNELIYQVQVESLHGSKTLWYSLDKSFSGILSDFADGPLVGLLIPAMAMGEDIYIDGIVSEKLLYNLSTSIQKILQNLLPSLQQIKIHVKDICCDGRKIGKGVATGFSGGIDSFCVLADHHYSNTLNTFKLSHLLFNNVGSHGKGGEKLFNKRYQKLLNFTKSIKIPLIKINSNLDEFYIKNIGFQKTHTLRNASVALILQNEICRWMYASSYNYSEIFVGPTYDISICDTVILPLLSTERIDMFSVSSEYTRVEKTLRVADISDSWSTLDVCASDDNNSGHLNCSECWKCLRTLVTLEIAGCLDKYSSVFDLNVYKKHKKKYFAKLINSNDKLLKEIIFFAKQRHYTFPVSSYLIHYPVYKFQNLTHQFMNKIYKY